MAGLEADINPEFLKNFFSETIYMVEGDIPVPAPALSAVKPAAAPTLETQKEEAKPAPAVAPANREEKPAPAVKNQITDHTPIQTPIIPKMPAAETPAVVGKYIISGANHKGVVVLVTVPDKEFVQLPQLEFLQKILRAIGLKPNDVAYVNNVSGATARYEDLQQELQVNYIISFASRLDTDLPHDKFGLYTPVTVGSVPVVFSQSLAMLERDVEHKKKLWGALQRVFL
jgi:DNA polymerase III psi subunit